MRKLQHQNSCRVETEQAREAAEGEDGLGNEGWGRQREARTLDGKILLLEERGKNLHLFYSNKISQL